MAQSTQSPVAGQTSPKSPTSPGRSSIPSAMQAMPDSRQQSFEEIYGPPENFLEIEVCYPLPILCYTTLYQHPNPHPSLLLQLPTCPLTNKPPAHPSPLGPRSPNPRHRPQHVHRLRNQLQHQHSRLQAAQFDRPPPLQRFRIFPRPLGARKCARDHPPATRKGLHQQI